MDRYTDLDALLDHIWTYVENGASDRKHPFRLPTFGTGGERVNMRSVVVREASRSPRIIRFHSDRRAQKVADIRHDPTALWHVWDADRSQQFRLWGRAEVHTDDEVADALWNQASPEELMVYASPEAPGTSVDEPRSGLTVDQQAELTMDDVADGRKRFAAITTTIHEIAWLHLHREGHYRARFTWNGDRFDGSWIIP